MAALEQCPTFLTLWQASIVHIDYHIPVPHLTPTDKELEWARENLIPHALHALQKIYEKLGPKFDKADLDQSVFKGFDLARRVQEHFDELGITLRRYAVFVGYTGAANARPHVDAHAVDIPMIARLNVPLQGQHGARLGWWKSTVDDPKMKSRKFEQWDGTQKKMRQAFSYLSPPEFEWPAADHTEHDPGPCWNRVELAHRLDLDALTEHRINFTAELATQISWNDLMGRLKKRGYLNQ